MGTTVKSAPVFLPEGSEHIMEPSMEEHSHAMSLEHYKPQPHCDVPLYIGVFFDGTNNNRDRDEPLREHSNVARLYNAHPAVDVPPPGRRELGHYRIYVPGVGTRFDANEEWRESMEGKSMGKGGQARILYGLLEVVNAVHKAFANDRPLFQPEAITEKLYDYVQRVEVGTPMTSTGTTSPFARAGAPGWNAWPWRSRPRSGRPTEAASARTTPSSASTSSASHAAQPRHGPSATG